MDCLLFLLSPRESLNRKRRRHEEKEHRQLFELWRVDKASFSKKYRSLTTKGRGNFWRWLHRTRSDDSLAANVRAEMNRLITELSERVIMSRKDRLR